MRPGRLLTLPLAAHPLTSQAADTTPDAATFSGQGVGWYEVTGEPIA